MNKARALILVGCVAATSATAAAAWHFWPVYEAQQRARGFLKDPGSAKFERVEFFRQTGGACGFVNAKNSMGGYVGLTHFVLPKDGNIVFEPQNSIEQGTTEQRLAAVKDRIAYLSRVIAVCPEEEDPGIARANKTADVK